MVFKVCKVVNIAYSKDLRVVGLYTGSSGNISGMSGCDVGSTDIQVNSLSTPVLSLL